MLRYKIKPNRDTDYRRLYFREMFVSPDMSFISGVTDISTGLMNLEEVYLVNSYNGYSELSRVETTEVLRQGRIKYTEVISGNVATYDFVDDSGITSSVTATYFEHDSDLSYIKDGKIIVDGKIYTVEDNTATLTVISFIEDNKVSIRGIEYRVDFLDEKPELRKNPFSEPLDESEYEYIKEPWTRVVKFVIRRSNETGLAVDDIKFGGYRHLITYGDENIYAYDGVSGLTINLPDGTSSIISNNYGDSEIYEHHSDLPLPYVFVETDNGSFEVQDEINITSTGGSFVVITTESDFLNLGVGSVIEARSTSNVVIDKPVVTFSSYTETGEVEEVSGITVFGRKYYVEDNIADLLQNNNTLMVYDAIDEDGCPISGYSIVNGDYLYLSAFTDCTQEVMSATSVDKMYYEKNENKIDYDLNPNFTILRRKGIRVGETIYPVVDITSMNQSNGDNTGDDMSYYNVSVSSSFTFNLVVAERLGGGVYVCYPTFNDDNLTEYETEEARREICRAIVQNKNKFIFSVKNLLIDYEEMEPIRYVLEALDSWRPFTVSDYNDYGRKIQVYRVVNYATFSIPLVSTPQNNLMREDIVKNVYVSEKEENSINDIVDMEKDVYYPVFESDKKIIEKLRFNLHFRTRNLDNWKIYQDDREIFGQAKSYTENYCNWFVTDYDFYKENSDPVKLQRSSDLLGFLGFTDPEIRNQALKISKSFLRLSFYSTNNPHTQVLLGTSVIHLDGQKALAKYLRYRHSLGIGFLNVKDYEEVGASGLTSGITSFSEASTFNEDGELEPYLLEGARLSSRFEVVDKHSTIDSSEGYYIYMFKDYGRRFHDTTVYMRVDFNHAGVGQSYPMIVPMNEGNMLTLENDVDKMKEGIPLSDIYNNLYIPVHLKYDENLNKYTYWFDDIYNSLNDDEDDVFEFNLFEIKYKNEAIEQLE